MNQTVGCWSILLLAFLSLLHIYPCNRRLSPTFHIFQVSLDTCCSSSPNDVPGFPSSCRWSEPPSQPHLPGHISTLPVVQSVPGGACGRAIRPGLVWPSAVAARPSRSQPPGDVSTLPGGQWLRWCNLSNLSVLIYIYLSILSNISIKLIHSINNLLIIMNNQIYLLIWDIIY